MPLISGPLVFSLRTGRRIPVPLLRREAEVRTPPSTDLTMGSSSGSPINALPFRQGLPKLLGVSLVLLAALLLSVSTVQAQGSDPDPGYDEEEALSIDRMLICPVCPAETIDQAQVELSKQMRRIVREMLAEGASREEILDFFVDRYGSEVLAAPPKSGFNLLAWILPVAGVLAGLVAVPLIIWSMASRGRPLAAGEPPMDAGLDPYLEAVDRDLAQSEMGGILPGGGRSPRGPEDRGEGGGDATNGEGPGVEHPGGEPLKENGDRD